VTAYVAEPVMHLPLRAKSRRRLAPLVCEMAAEMRASFEAPDCGEPRREDDRGLMDGY